MSSFPGRGEESVARRGEGVGRREGGEQTKRDHLIAILASFRSAGSTPLAATKECGTTIETRGGWTLRKQLTLRGDGTAISRMARRRR